MFSNTGDQRATRPSNLGCYCCGEFGHVRRECTIDLDTLWCTSCEGSGHVAEVCPTTNNLYGSRGSSLNHSRRPSSKRAKTRTLDGQAQKMLHPGTNQCAGTPGPATRILPKDSGPTALLAFQPVGHRGATTATGSKNQCFHPRFPVQNDLKMLNVHTWAQKDEAPLEWLRQGSTVLAVCNMGFTKTLVLEAFADSLGLRKTMFPEGKAPKVCLGNSDTVTPVAGVEFWAVKDIQDTQPGHCPRRRISALVLRNLPTTILMSGDDLITLGLLPPAWPNHGDEWGTRTGDVPRTDFPADRNLTEKEVQTSTLLTSSLGDNPGQDDQDDDSLGEPMETNDNTSDLYDPKMVIPDSWPWACW